MAQLGHFLPPVSLPRFVYWPQDLARTIAETLSLPGGYANVRIAHGPEDDAPVWYYYRHTDVYDSGGTSGVREGAYNGIKRTVYLYTNVDRLADKLARLLLDPRLEYAEFMNKLVSREYERVYGWQIQR